MVSFIFLAPSAKLTLEKMVIQFFVGLENVELEFVSYWVKAWGLVEFRLGIHWRGNSLIVWEFG